MSPVGVCCCDLLPLFCGLSKLLKCSFTSTESVGFLRMGAQDGHLDFHTAPKLWIIVDCCLFMSIKAPTEGVLNNAAQRFCSVLFYLFFSPSFQQPALSAVSLQKLCLWFSVLTKCVLPWQNWHGWLGTKTNPQLFIYACLSRKCNTPQCVKKNNKKQNKKQAAN